MQTTPQDINRSRVGDVIDALRLIDCDALDALDDDILKAFHNAIWVAARYTYTQIDKRRCGRARAPAPDAIEEAAT